MIEDGQVEVTGKTMYESAATYLVLKYITFFTYPKNKQGIFIPTPIINNQTPVMHKRERGEADNTSERDGGKTNNACKRERGKTNDVRERGNTVDASEVVRKHFQCD